jgi:uncharacterized protein (TIGR02246 family)
MLVALVLAGVLSGGAAASVEAERAELLRLETAWNEAHRSGDAKALDELWADDLTVAVPGMPRFSRAQVLEVARSGRVRFERYETSGVDVRIHGDSALVTGRMLRTRRLGERSIDDDWLFTKVYIRQAGRWRVTAFHASNGPEPGP